MEKRLRSSLQTSSEEFLKSATKQSLKSSKSYLKTLIFGISSSSDLCSSLPLSLHQSISRYIQIYQTLLEPNPNPNPEKSPCSPPTKRVRRSSGRFKNKVEPDSDDEKQRVLEKLQILAYIMNLCVLHPKKAFSPVDLLPGAQELHVNLIVLEADGVLASEISNLCEEWWKGDLEGRESLISQFLPFLLSRSLTLKKKQDVHRVCALREAFAMFDFEDESIEDLKLLLIRCVIAPVYMKTDEGRRFVAYTFGLNAQLLKELLAMIRSQIPFGRKSMLEAYGDIVFRAWKVAEGEYRDEIENGFLQGLIEGAIYASSVEFAASIRRVLGAFINQRTTNGVEKLLFRLAEPVIFRSLQVANSNVRQNALYLLLDLFPLEDPEATKEVKDTLLDKEFYLLERLLVDDCPDVRVVAVEGSCRVLHLFWEIIPSPTITKIITKIFDDMSHDICHEVRLSTLNGIIYLFGNPQSHEILKVLLPRLRHLILDSVLSIRTAFIDLLLLVRDIRNFQFNKVVELDVLLSTLANDQPHVAQKITRLLMPSYFPSKASIEEACNRCVTLVKRSPVAGARFCELAVFEGASLESLMELVKVFISLILSPNMLNTDHIEGSLQAAANLCSSLIKEPSYTHALKELFSGEKLKCLLSRVSNTRAQSSIFNIASVISVDDVAGLLDECMALITRCTGLSEDIEKQAEVRSAHRLLMSCGWLDNMVEVLASLLQKTAYRCHIKFGIEIPKLSIFSAKRKNLKSSGKFSAQRKHVGGKKQSSFEEDYAIAVGIAWQIKDLLKSEDTSKAILASQNLKSIFLALKIICEISILHCIHCEYMHVAPVLAYTDLSLHLTLQNVDISSSEGCGTKKSDGSDSSSSSPKATLEQTLSHMLNCTEKLLGAADSEKYGQSASVSEQAENKTARPSKRRCKEREEDAMDHSDGGSVYTEAKKLSNKVKMLTAVLKFMADASAMGFVCHNHEWGLKFTSGFVRFIASTLQKQHNNRTHFEEDVKDIILCLKSSFTYAAKLLSLALRDTTEDSPPPSQTFYLANDLLDIIISIELFFGHGYAARLVAAAKTWLPDLILALGFGYLLKQSCGEEAQWTGIDSIRLHFPSWLLALVKTELSELSKVGLEEEDERVSEPEEFRAFKKLVGMIVTLVKGNPTILDAFGEIFLIGSIVGLERKDYSLVLGLLHYVRVKLFKQEDRDWGDMMLACLQDMYPRIERQIEEEEESDEEERKKLDSARELLEPVWMYHIYETGKVSEMEE
ncbi:hypothetical protein UlMin_039039 [Ulmus minor]